MSLPSPGRAAGAVPGCAPWVRAEGGAEAGFALPRLPYLRLRCTLRALAPATLPSFHGSLLRGAFGHALRRCACALGPAQPCASCRLRRSCPYARLFETLSEGEPPPFLRGLPASPRPYLFEPGAAARDFAPGRELPFDLLLFGRAAELADYALLAVERMAAAGLGSRRVPFALDRAEAEPGELPPPGPPEGEAGAPAAALLRFATPTRVKRCGRLVAEVGFRGLVFAMLRRHLEMAHFHAPGEPASWEIRPLLERAGRVRAAGAALRWVDWERYSSRQRTRMRLGGFTGELRVEGELGPFLPLLRSAEVLHVGKGTTFGLGKLEVEIPARREPPDGPEGPPGPPEGSRRAG